MLNQTPLLTTMICAVALLAIPQPAHAQINEFKIMASDGAELDEFGISASISGDYAVVGAYRDDDKGIGSGSAYIFKRNGESWTQEAKLLPSDGYPDDRFGKSVAISGDHAVVGASFHRGSGFRSGSAYLFKRTGSSWTQEVELLPSDWATSDEFGFSVAISGDYLVVGAVADDDNGFNAGSAYVFGRTDSSWTEEAKLLQTDGAAGDAFGVSVSISGDYAIVGANQDDDNGIDAGSAYLFKRFGTSWAQEAKLLASDGASGDRFGEASISGDYIVVGASRDDDNGSFSGSAYLYTGFATSVAVEPETAGLPVEFALWQNYPNPFNPETTIAYDLPQASPVRLAVYDLLGRELAQLVDRALMAGYHQVSWNGKSRDRQEVPTGIYIAQLVTPEYTESIKMVLLK